MIICFKYFWSNIKRQRFIVILVYLSLVAHYSKNFWGCTKGFTCKLGIPRYYPLSLSLPFCLFIKNWTHLSSHSKFPFHLSQLDEPARNIINYKDFCCCKKYFHTDYYLQARWVVITILMPADLAPLTWRQQRRRQQLNSPDR